MNTRICIYNPAWATLGGGEKYLLAMAEVLSRSPDYTVELLVEDPSLTAERFASYFGVDLSRVTLICDRHVVRRMTGADVGIIASNFRFQGFHARKNVYVLHTPYGPLSFTTIAGKALRGAVKDAAKDYFRLNLFRAARRTDLTIVNSGFAQQALVRFHRIPAQVLYPPIDDFFVETSKRQVIVSVGRFFHGLYNDKRQDIMIDAFKMLCDRHPSLRPEYHLLGSCGNDAASLAYLEDLRARAQGYPIILHPNAPYDQVRQWYNQSAIFWHAAGYGIDEDSHPQNVEHFGMTTVEAMSAGCVPVVINKGGQKEIVLHGKSGYLWNDLDELVYHTATLFANPELRTTMAGEARQRWRDFDKEHFAAQVFFYIQQLTGKNDGKR